jgi:hypothetical protein
MTGASGGTLVRVNGTFYGSPGKGARVQARIPVTAGTVLHIYVGGQGRIIAGFSSETGGWNGGGDVGGTTGGCNTFGGGGATDIRVGGFSLSDRIIVAGGGGGAYANTNICGPQAGGDGGQVGTGGTAAYLTGPSPCNNGPGGGGGSATAGGTAGGAGSTAGNVGGLGYGGKGNSHCSGGGAGGYYGGES